MKNITTPSRTAYLKALISKVEHFLKRMRWKAFFFEKENDEANNDSSEEEITFNNYGFKSPRTPPAQEALKPFEKAMYKMIQDIKFKDRPNAFQQKLKQDLNEIRRSSNLLVPADKSTNLYEVDTENYNKLLFENITKTYKNHQPLQRYRLIQKQKA